MRNFKSKPRLTTYKPIILGILLFILISLSAFVLYLRMDHSQKAFTEDKIKSRDIGSLYEFYVSSKPEIDNRPFYGKPDAPITIVAFLDIYSDSSKHFMNHIFPQLQEDYINTGKARYYHKNNINAEQYSEKGETFIYMQSLACINQIDKEHYYDFYFDLFDLASTDEIITLAEKYHISKQEFESCIKTQEYDEIRQDLLEVERFGMIGINPRFYIGLNGNENQIIDGVPSYNRFRRTIKNLQVLIGD